MQYRRCATRNGRKSGEQGQAIILIAVGFVGLLAMLGLAIDAGLLAFRVGQLRRAVDTAALSAANQIREGYDPSQVQFAAKEMILLNLTDIGIDPGTLDTLIETCDTPGVTFCDAQHRKLARVWSQVEVEFIFMPIVGIESWQIEADAISEVASLDLVLVIDTSSSMAFDSPAGAFPDCNDSKSCDPFEAVRAAAIKLIGSLWFPYDRVALVTFDGVGRVDLQLAECDFADSESKKACIIQALEDMRIQDNWVDPNRSPEDNCGQWTPNPSGCMTTNSGHGLRIAYTELFDNRRDESLAVVLFLSDGVANAANMIPNPAQVTDWHCPSGTFWNVSQEYDEATLDPDKIVADLEFIRLYENLIGMTGPPFCNDGIGDERHTVADPYYDADDYARDWADFLACFPGELGIGACGVEGLGATIFTIGLGDQVTNHMYAVPARGMDPDLGEHLLRYIANIGFDGNPYNDPCKDVPIAGQCGNYYFAPDGDKLDGIFDAIGKRIFTRLTH